MDTRAAHGGEPGALASPRAKAARPEVVGSNPTGPTISYRLFADVLGFFGRIWSLLDQAISSVFFQDYECLFGMKTSVDDSGARIPPHFLMNSGLSLKALGEIRSFGCE